PDATNWFACFDVVQVNEDEMRQLSPDPMGMAAQVLGAGVSLLAVTLGARGAAYVATAGFDRWEKRGKGEGEKGKQRSLSPLPPFPSSPARTALIPAPHVDMLDPTGCGDVFGAVLCSRLLAGEDVEAALREANRLAARNATFRGAS